MLQTSRHQSFLKLKLKTFLTLRNTVTNSLNLILKLIILFNIHTADVL